MAEEEAPLARELTRFIDARAAPLHLFVSWSDVQGLWGGTAFQLVEGRRLERAVYGGGGHVRECGTREVEAEAVVELLAILRDVRAWDDTPPSAMPVPDQVIFSVSVRLRPLFAGFMELQPQRTERVRAWFARHATDLAPLPALSPKPPFEPLLEPSALTRYFTGFESVTVGEAFAHLLDPETLPRLCAASGWVVWRLPRPVLHPGLVRHPGAPVARLLGMSADELQDVLYGANAIGAPELLTRLRSVNVRADAICPTSVPALPRPVLDAAVEAAHAKLAQAFGPAVIVMPPPPANARDPGNVKLQRAFDAFFDAMAGYLRA